MAGFVECLDNEEAEEGTENRDGERDVACIIFLQPRNCTILCIWVKLSCFNTVKAKRVLLICPKPPDSDPQKKVARIRHETQIHILNLLITSLELKTPNLALYLLGYEVKKPVSSTNLQDPGQTSCCMFILVAVVISAIFVGFRFGWSRDQLT